MFPETRMRRLRSCGRMEALTSETALSPSDLILPLFFDERISEDAATDSMPGVPTHPLEGFEGIAGGMLDDGVGAAMVFGVPAVKDAAGSQAYAADGVAQRAVAGLKECSDLLVIADLCMCEYTDHGHCGVLKDGKVDNDATLELYGRIAVSQAQAGADVIAPSGMMDGQVGAIRAALDDAGFRDVAVMAYSAKYCSSFYGPFRDIAGSCLGKGSRREYQMQCGNRREAMREIELDLQEGADIVMVKPALPYLDVVRDARERFDAPLAAYQVSGEYAMIKAAAANGWLDGGRAMMESLTSIKRAGADMIVTYFAREAARALEGRP